MIGYVSVMMIFSFTYRKQRRHSKTPSSREMKKCEKLFTDYVWKSTSRNCSLIMLWTDVSHIGWHKTMDLFWKTLYVLFFWVEFGWHLCGFESPSIVGGGIAEEAVPQVFVSSNIAGKWLQMSHEINLPTFHYTGWLIGILIMVY